MPDYTIYRHVSPLNFVIKFDKRIGLSANGSRASLFLVQNVTAKLWKLTQMVTSLMQEVVTLKVPLMVEVSSGQNWAEAH